MMIEKKINQGDDFFLKKNINKDDGIDYDSNQVLDVRVHHGKSSALRVVAVLNKIVLIDIIIYVISYVLYL